MRHQQSRPVQGVESTVRGRTRDHLPDDIFAYDTYVGRPALSQALLASLPWITGDGDVVDQSVDPDIDGLMLFITRHRNTPLYSRSRSRNRQVLQRCGAKCCKQIGMMRWGVNSCLSARKVAYVPSGLVSSHSIIRT